MSPHRRITEYRGYFTETGFDPNHGFTEVPMEHRFPDIKEIGGPPHLSAQVANRLATTEARLRAAHAVHLGYPYNLIGECVLPPGLHGLLINNLGDPYVGSHYASEVCALEREAVTWLMQLWECPEPDEFWGSVGASGTEGNLWALYLAREALPCARLLYSREAHYSIPKAARILGMATTPVDCTPDGAIDISALDRILATQRGVPVIVALTCGTTVKGAHDDIAGVIACLDEAGVGPDSRFVHVDGALNAMVLPFIDDVPAGLRPTFRHGIDSLSTSGHKMIGTPMPCGVLVARRSHVDRIASAIAYLRSDDTTLMGSRNGHAVLAIWSRLIGHGAAGFRADIRASLARTHRLVAALRSAGVPVLCNPHALTVLFPKPAEDIVTTYQLACTAGDAHAIVMPSVTEALLDCFLADYLDWWISARETPSISGPSPDPANAAARGSPGVPPCQMDPPACAQQGSQHAAAGA